MEVGFAYIALVLSGLIVLPILIVKPQILNPRLIIYALIIITMLPNLFNIPISFGSVNVYPKDLLLILYSCCAGWAVFMRVFKRERIFNIADDAKTLMVFVLLYIMMHIVYIIVGLLQGISPEKIVRRFSVYSGCLYFFFPLLFFQDKDQFKKILIFIVIIAVLNPVSQIFQYLITPQWRQAITSSGTVRIGSGGLTIVAGGLFTMIIWKKEIKYYLISFSPILSIILVAHRSALLALGVALPFVLIWAKKITKSLLFVYLVGLTLFLSFLAINMITGHNFVNDSITRAADTFNAENATTEGRIEAIGVNWYVFERKPIMGIGYNLESLRNMFTSGLWGTYKRDENGYYYTFGEICVLEPHNFALRILTHTGIVGTFLIFTIIGLVLKRSYSLIREGGIVRDSGIFLFSSIVFFLVLGLMNTTFFTEGHIFWFLCGASILISQDVVADV